MGKQTRSSYVPDVMCLLANRDCLSVTLRHLFDYLLPHSNKNEWMILKVEAICSRLVTRAVGDFCAGTEHSDHANGKMREGVCGKMTPRKG